MGLKKKDLVYHYLNRLQTDGYISDPVNTVADKLGVSCSLIRKVAGEMGIHFKRKELKCRYAPGLKNYSGQIRQILEANPDISYADLGKMLGVSRQRACVLVKKLGIRKEPKNRTQKQNKRIAYAVAHAAFDDTIDKITLSRFLRERGINYRAFKRYAASHSDDPAFMDFYCRMQKKESLADKIAKYLKRTDLSFSEIAKRLNTSQQYVSKINRIRNIRERRRRLKDLEME